MTTRDPNTPPQRPSGAESGQPLPKKDAGDKRPSSSANPSEHEGADDSEVGDRVGPGAGYDDEPVQEKDDSGVS